jgi:hypothetical protein
VSAHRWPAVTWGLWALGVVVLVAPPLGMADPMVLTLILDPELLALMTAAGLLLVRLDLAAAVRSLAGHVAAGCHLKFVQRLPSSPFRDRESP